ncbi:hypothetical protein [Streptomyces bungoensis]|uniref:hypothetical protein n=1 Tax=Streptomyces bungoensis TaxID=285568 RepID=UPI0034214B66
MSRRAGSAALRFDGFIAGLGTTSGTRLVLGHWPRSPFGPFSDVMLERPDGHRLLLAPTPETARFISGTYRFDEVRVVPVQVRVRGDDWTVVAGDVLRLRFTVGRRGLTGLALRAVPGSLAAWPPWTAVTDLPARLLLGVRTRGSAGGGRREWYGARDLHRVTAVSATHEGRDLGSPALVVPPVRFGFGSTPRRPALVRVTTTVGPERAGSGMSGRARRGVSSDHGSEDPAPAGAGDGPGSGEHGRDR